MSRIDPYKTTKVLPPILPKPNTLLNTRLDQQDSAPHRYTHSEHLVQQAIADLPAVVNQLAQCELDGCTFTNSHTLSEIARNSIRAINKHHAIRESNGNQRAAQEMLETLNEHLGENLATLVYQEVRHLRSREVAHQALEVEDQLTQERIKRQQISMHGEVIKSLNDIQDLLVDETASNPNVHANERLKIRSNYIVGHTPSASIQPGSLSQQDAPLDAEILHKYSTDTNLLIPFDHIGPIESTADFKRRIDSILNQNDTPTTIPNTVSPPRPLSADASLRATPSYTRFDETVYSMNGSQYQQRYGLPAPPTLENIFTAPQPTHHIDYASVSSAPLSAVSQYQHPHHLGADDFSTQSGLTAPKSPQLQRYIDAVPDKFSTSSSTSRYAQSNSSAYGRPGSGGSVTNSSSSDYENDHDDWFSEEEDDEYDDDDDEMDDFTYNTMADYYDQSSLGSTFSDFSFSR